MSTVNGPEQNIRNVDDASDERYALSADPNDRQVGGNHYKKGGEEHWDRVARLGLDYFQAQVTKYVERCWEKLGIEDLEKALHFLEKYIKLSRAVGRTGKMEEFLISIQAERDFLAAHIETEDGTFTFPDGSSIDCKKAAPHPPFTIMALQSDWKYTLEGIKENGVTWRCRICRELFTGRLDQQPHSVHSVCK